MCHWECSYLLAFLPSHLPPQEPKETKENPRPQGISQDGVQDLESSLPHGANSQQCSCSALYQSWV